VRRMTIEITQAEEGGDIQTVFEAVNLPGEDCNFRRYCEKAAAGVEAAANFMKLKSAKVGTTRENAREVLQ